MKWFCWHDWSKWKTYRWQGTLWYCDHSIPVSRTKQARVCLKCGKEVHRRVYVAEGSEYEKVVEA